MLFLSCACVSRCGGCCALSVCVCDLLIFLDGESLEVQHESKSEEARVKGALQLGLYTILDYHYCMVYSIHKGGRGGVVYRPIVVQ